MTETGRLFRVGGAARKVAACPLAEAAPAAIKGRLRDSFGMDHATVEVERGACADDG